MKKSLFTLLLVLTISSCSDQNDCVNGDFINTFQLEQIGCAKDTRYSLFVPSLRDENAFKVYSNLNDALREIEGTDRACNLSAIDFGRYDLLIGQIWIESNNHKINYVYIEKCNGKSELNVELFQNRGGRAQFITYHTIIPKTHGYTPVVSTKIIYP